MELSRGKSLWCLVLLRCLDVHVYAWISKRGRSLHMRFLFSDLSFNCVKTREKTRSPYDDHLLLNFFFFFQAVRACRAMKTPLHCVYVEEWLERPLVSRVSAQAALRACTSQGCSLWASRAVSSSWLFFCSRLFFPLSKEVDRCLDRLSPHCSVMPRGASTKSSIASRLSLP